MSQTERNDSDDGLDVEVLTYRMKENILVSLDRINWEEAGRKFKWAVLLRLASRRSVQKTLIEDAVGKVWKISKPATYMKVEKGTLLINFHSMEDQEKVLKGGLGLLKVLHFCYRKWEEGMTEDDFDTTKN